MPIQKTCKKCGKMFSVRPSWDRVQYCSQSCARLGKPLSEDVKRKLSESNIGKHSEKRPSNANENNYLWKGVNVSYRALHRWVESHRGKPEKCEDCGADNLKGREIHWANKSGKYKRDLNDWMRLCRNCHFKYDKLKR